MCACKKSHKTFCFLDVCACKTPKKKIQPQRGVCRQDKNTTYVWIHICIPIQQYLGVYVKTVNYMIYVLVSVNQKNTYLQREMCGCEITILYYIYKHTNFLYLLNTYKYIHTYIYINPKKCIQREMCGCKTIILYCIYIRTDFLYLLNINTDFMY